MKEIRSCLTTRGKHVLILGLTVAGCLLGATSAVLVSTICPDNRQKNVVLAGESEAVGDAVEISMGNEKSAVVEERKENVAAITPQWLYYESSRGKNCNAETGKYFDVLVNRWTKGKLTDNELGELMTEYLTKQNISITTSGVQSKVRCLFATVEELPDYTEILRETGFYYDFIGVYTDGEYDAYGNLICYYWEAGVR